MLTLSPSLQIDEFPADVDASMDVEVLVPASSGPIDTIADADVVATEARDDSSFTQYEADVSAQGADDLSTITFTAKQEPSPLGPSTRTRKRRASSLATTEEEDIKPSTAESSMHTPANKMNKVARRKAARKDKRRKLNKSVSAPNPIAVEDHEEECIIVQSSPSYSQDTPPGPSRHPRGRLASKLSGWLPRLPFFSPQQSHAEPIAAPIEEPAQSSSQTKSRKRNQSVVEVEIEVPSPTAFLVGERRAWNNGEVSREEEADSSESTQLSNDKSSPSVPSRRSRRRSTRSTASPARSTSNNHEPTPERQPRLLQLVNEALEMKDSLDEMDSQSIEELAEKADELRKYGMAVLRARLKRHESRSHFKV